MSQRLSSRLRELLALFEGLHGLHARLLEVVRQKVEAMKRADISAIRAVTEEEKVLVSRISERNGLRRQIMDLIGSELGLPAGRARSMSFSQLESYLDGDAAGRVRRAADDLRGVIVELSEANHIAGLITREMIGHFERVFTAIGAPDQPPVSYAATGRMVCARETRIMDAVG